MKYLFISFLVFLSFLIGNFIAKYTKDEIKTGKRYFLLLEKILLGIFILFLGIQAGFPGILGGILGIILAFFFPNPVIYLGIGLAFSSGSLFLSSMVFLYGLVYGSLQHLGKKILPFFLFFMIPSVAVFVFPLTSYAPFFLGFSAGALGFIFVKENGKARKRP